MPSKAKKPCSSPRCPNLADGLYCESHKIVYGDDKAAINKNYDKYQRDERSATFYRSKQWRELRAVVMHKQLGLCQQHLSEGHPTPGNIVDHIIPIKKDWSKRLLESNLQVLCIGCHNRKTKMDLK